MDVVRRWRGSTFFWAEREPDNRVNENYGAMRNYKWHDTSATQFITTFFCSRAVVVRERKTWEDALEHCRERHRGLGHRDGAPPERAERRRDHGARLDRSAVLPRRLAVGGRAAAGSRGLGPGGEGRVPGGQAGSRAGRGGEPDRRRRRRMVFTGRGSMHTICRVSKVKGR